MHAGLLTCMYRLAFRSTQGGGVQRTFMYAHIQGHKGSSTDLQLYRHASLYKCGDALPYSGMQGIPFKDCLLCPLSHFDTGNEEKLQHAPVKSSKGRAVAWSSPSPGSRLTTRTVAPRSWIDLHHLAASMSAMESFSTVLDDCVYTVSVLVLVLVSVLVSVVVTAPPMFSFQRNSAKK